MIPHLDIPQCELCETDKNLRCVSEEYQLHLCQKCENKMSLYWEDKS